MTKFKFYLSKSEEVLVEAENAEDARMQVIEDAFYDWADYVDEGTEVSEPEKEVPKK